MPRSCKIYSCKILRSDRCCADCDRLVCRDRCLNNPDRCGQVVTGKKMRIHKRGSVKDEPERPRITVFPGEGKDKFMGR